jgi:tryptophan synthase alpha chain
VSPGPLTGGRIETRFADLTRRNRAGFIAYVMAGDPDAETALKILEGLPAAGADLIELGMPFSDPMADGPSIQRAALRALASGMTLDGVFDLARRFRQSDTTTPIVLMGYLNPIVTMGFDAFAERAAAAGIDGLIAVDCPPEEADPLADALDREGVNLIRLATPTTDDARLAIVARRTRGFVYYVSVAGVTGAKSAAPDDVALAVARVRAATSLPVAVGFGIRTAEQAAAVARVADAAVVGSALVDAIAGAIGDGADPSARVLAAAAALGEAVAVARAMAEEAR